MSANILTHYNSSLPITLAADASAYGVGSVTSHDGFRHQIAFASWTLTKTECNYAQLQKEALALVFRVKNSTNTSMAAILTLLRITDCSKQFWDHKKVFHHSFAKMGSSAISLPVRHSLQVHK